MLHAPAASQGKDPAASYKQRLGVWMFACYCLFYAGFVAVNLFAPALMGRTVLLGLNLSVVYGFALILVAMIQALVYDAMCKRKELELRDQVGPEGVQ